MVGSAAVPAGHRRRAGAVLLGLGAVPAVRRRDDRARASRCSSAIDQAGFKLPLDERVLADADTLFVFGLDHMVTEQEAAPEEIEAVRAVPASAKGPASSSVRTTTSARPTTRRSATWSTGTTATRWCRASKRFGQYTRSLMKGLGIPVENRYGLRPARVAGNQDARAPCPLRGIWTRAAGSRA